MLVYQSVVNVVRITKSTKNIQDTAFKAPINRSGWAISRMIGGTTGTNVKAAKHVAKALVFLN